MNQDRVEKKTILTLCIVQEGNFVYLGYKKRGFGEGWWNGYGGNLEPGETIEETRDREFFEETNATLVRSEKCGILEFRRDGKEGVREVHVYNVVEYTGALKETNEMRHAKFPKDALPYNQMFPADRIWIPYVLAGKKIRGAFRYSKDYDVLEQMVEEVKEF